MEELTRWFIIKAWLGHYITWRCMWGMFKLRRERIEAQRIAEAEARHLQDVENIVNNVTVELYEKNGQMLTRVVA